MTTATSVLAILTSAEAGEFTTLDELRGRIGCTRREAEEAVEDLRKAGEPIIAGAFGLRYSTDAKEVMAYVKARRKRELHIALGTRRLMQTARRLDWSQGTLGL